MIGHVYAVFREKTPQEMEVDPVVDRVMLYPTFAGKPEALDHLVKVTHGDPDHVFYLDVIYRGR